MLQVLSQQAERSERGAGREEGLEWSGRVFGGCYGGVVGDVGVWVLGHGGGGCGVCGAAAGVVRSVAEGAGAEGWGAEGGDQGHGGLFLGIDG